MNKKVRNVIFNIFWIIFTGIPSAIYNGAIGVLFCMTIIGIPFGLQYFKFIPLVFAPAGKRVITHCNSNPVLNILWFIFGGFEAGIYHYFLSILCSITLIGDPIGRQLRKIAAFNFFPFGAEIIKDGEYSMNRNTDYDYNLLAGRIFANSKKRMPDGQIVEDYIGKEVAELRKTTKRYERSKLLSMSPIVFVVLLLIGAKLIAEVTYNWDIRIYFALVFGYLGLLVVILITILTALQKISNERDMKYMKPKLNAIMELYPNGAPINEKFRDYQLLLTFDIKQVLNPSPQKRARNNFLLIGLLILLAIYLAWQFIFSKLIS